MTSFQLYATRNRRNTTLDDLSRQHGSEKPSFRTIRESSTQVGHNQSNPRRIRATMSDRIHRVPVSPTSVDVTDARKGLETSAAHSKKNGRFLRILNYA
jgi:hypothetical protein